MPWRFSPLRIAGAVAVTIIGALLVLTAYANPPILADVPIITSRGDVTIQNALLQADAAALQPGAPIDPAVVRRARPASGAARLLRMAPLSSNALLYAQFDRRFANNVAARDQLSAAALKADPRSRGAHATQFLIAVRERNFGNAVTAIERMINVAPGDTEAVLPLLALLTNDPAARQVLLARLRQARPWHAQLAGRLAQTPMPTGQLVAFGELLVRHPDPTARQAILGGLIDRGAFREARRLWAPTKPGVTDRTTVVGPRFDEASQGYPFGWTLHQDGSDGADLGDPDGLFVRYSGRTAMTFASQLLVLPQGRYRLVVSGIEGDLGGSGLTWSLNCRPANTALASIDLGAASSVGGRASVDFDVDPTCTAQQLALTIARADFPENREMRIGAVDIRRVE